MTQTFSYQAGNETKTVSLEATGAGYTLTVDGTEYAVSDVQREGQRVSFTLAGERYTFHHAAEGQRRYLVAGGQQWRLERLTEQTRRRRASGQAAHTGDLTATMPGQVQSIAVSEGDSVAAGDTLLILEAMKMEQRLTAPFAARVAKLHCAVGQVVEQGAVLIELEDVADTQGETDGG